MIAGTLGLLADPADDPIEDDIEQGYRGIDVEQSIGYLDGHRVQTGTVAGRVMQEAEQISITGDGIDVWREKREQQVAAEWVADVEQDGWLLAARMFSTDEEHRPDWPFSLFETHLGVEIQPMGLDVQAFVTRQQDAGRDFSVEMATQEGDESDDVSIDWGKRVSKAQGLQSNVGCALTVNWEGTFQRLVVYESGYTAIWSAEDLNPTVARFVTEEVVPVAAPLSEDDEADTEQTEVTA